MKAIIFHLLIFLICCSCSTQHIISSLSISTTLNHEPLGTGDEFTVSVDAIDNDGIEYVTLDIRGMNFRETYNNIQGREWDYERTFTVPPDTKPGSHDIRLTLVDLNGDVKVKVNSIQVESLK